MIQVPSLSSSLDISTSQDTMILVERFYNENMFYILRCVYGIDNGFVQYSNI